MPLAGGTPSRYSDKSSTWAAVSPDGKLIALRYFDDQAYANKIAVIPFPGGQPIKTLDVSVSFRDVGLGWTADSKSIIYADARGNGEDADLKQLPTRGRTTFWCSNDDRDVPFHEHPDERSELCVEDTRGDELDERRRTGRGGSHDSGA